MLFKLYNSKIRFLTKIKVNSNIIQLVHLNPSCSVSSLVSHRSVNQDCAPNLYNFGLGATNSIDQYKCTVLRVICDDFTLVILWYFFLNFAMVFYIDGS